MSSYKDLVVWQKAMETVLRIYEITERFPGGEKFGIVSQMRRAAVSIPSNIAEGQTRLSNKEFIRFLLVSRGSCAELETQVLICVGLKYITREESEQILGELDKIGKMISKLIMALQNRMKT